MKAKQLLDLLATRHSEDVFVAECKDGPTWTGSGIRLDAWAMKRRWSPITMIGYEIKTSRSDFVRDDKWTRYLDMCHQLYFVCPAKLIQPAEVADNCGLIWASNTGTRLYTKKKAHRREIELPAELLIYILMSRATIQKENANTKDWEAWIEQQRRDKDIGWEVRKMLQEKTRGILEENRRLHSRMKEYNHLLKRMSELGLDPEKAASTWQFESQLSTLLGRVDPHVRRSMRMTAQQLLKAVDELEALERQRV